MKVLFISYFLLLTSVVDGHSIYVRGGEREQVNLARRRLALSLSGDDEVDCTEPDSCKGARVSDNAILNCNRARVCQSVFALDQSVVNCNRKHCCSQLVADESSTVNCEGSFSFHGEGTCPDIVAMGRNSVINCNGKGSCGGTQSDARGHTTINCRGDGSCNWLQGRQYATINCIHKTSCKDLRIDTAPPHKVTVNCAVGLLHVDPAKCHNMLPLLEDPSTSSGEKKVGKASWIGGSVVIALLLGGSLAVLIILGRKNQWTWWKRCCGQARRDEEEDEQETKENADQVVGEGKTREFENGEKTELNESATPEHSV